MQKFADMHMHTTHSDGKFSVQQIFERAQEKRLSAIIITDHDCFSGYEEAIYYSEKTGIETIIGSEVSTNHRGKDVHILAYGFNMNHRMLTSQLKKISDDRIVRARKMCEKLNRSGVKIDFDDVLEESIGGNIARPHIARVLIKMKVVKTIQEAFDKYLSNFGIAYVPKYKFDTKRAIETINNAGGVSVVAHIGRYFSLKRLNEFCEWGLKGVEVYHPSHTREIREELLKYTEEKKLIKTGGSDFHELTNFTDLGKENVPYEYYENLLKQFREAV